MNTVIVLTVQRTSKLSASSLLFRIQLAEFWRESWCVWVGIFLTPSVQHK